MTPAEYASKIVSQIWGLPPLRARTILASMVVRLLRPNTASPARSERPAEDCFGDPLPKMQIIGNIARIPITGIISINVPPWLKEYGINLTDANDIAEEVGQALADNNVERIVQDHDSPGGLTLAGEKLFETFEAANRKKPVHTYIADGCECASTAFYSAAPSRSILAARHADGIGCVGVYLAWLDDTEFWAQMGIKFEVFRSGEFKGLGIDALTARQREYLQGLVDSEGDLFRKNVSKYRTLITREDMEGQWFKAVEAAKRGFVTGFADDFNAAARKFQNELKAAA